ncbi:MarR family transcriptional regulator [Nonomuraea phyllanthi]|uniref:MarR family transcriptional regulator n=1 Tax=Nonomuraea phyllanthi TaxID=2219224 RepID=A0A5C4W1U9_9ACTN|nr:MarR family transcriptional regulator [Nonomuraea phyllanthi]KAB8191496.1 MarR family transcriptional regulator [Nonomuraea phyllanthi]QFY13178.1 MarR family transcriptional regulator [Nonomuraea phyllanthi]
MLNVNDVNATSLPGTLAFRFGTLGAMVTDLFVAALAPLDLKPKHVGVMVMLDLHGPAAQLEIARTMGVAPSLVVSLADHLEKLGAIQRVRDAGDRRRQVLSLTGKGRELLADALAAANRLDADLAGPLNEKDRKELNRLLGVLAAEAGLPH